MTIFKIGPGGRFNIPWQRRGGLLPLSRIQMPPPQFVPTGRDTYRLEPVNKPDLPPHFHVVYQTPTFNIPKLQTFEQAVTASVPKGLLNCSQMDCEWYRDGKEGFDEGAPFRHPQGVECGDEAGCLDPNCPCPQRVIEWPDGAASGHIVPCRFCDGRWRVTNPGPGGGNTRQVVFDEYFYRLDQGADSLVTIVKRGL